MASWNVVSVYSNVGTDFPELHKSIVELKSVLQDFEDGFGKKISREPMICREYTSPGASNGRSGGGDGASGHDGSHHGGSACLSIEPAPEATNDGANDAATPHENTGAGPQQDSNLDNLFNEPESVASAIDSMPPPAFSPPNLMQMIQRHNESGAIDDEGEADNVPACRVTESPLFEREHASPEIVRRSQTAVPKTKLKSTKVSEASTIPNLKPKSGLRRSLPTPSSHTLTHTHTHPNIPSSNFTPPSTSSLSAILARCSPTPSTSSSQQTSRFNSPGIKEKKNLEDMSTTALRAAYKERKSDLIKTFGGNNNVPAQYRVQMQRMMAEVRRREREEAEAEEAAGRGDEDEDGGRASIGKKIDGGGDEEEGEERCRESVFKRPDGGKAFGGGGMGRSVLGGKKNGSAGGVGDMPPVAPMMHVRKESEGRREH